MIVLKSESLNKLKKEGSIIGILFILFVLIFKIIFFKEDFLVVLRIVFSIFWMFVVPGYFAMFYWSEKLNFAERLVIGMAFSAAIVGILSYYLGLIGLNIQYHAVILPTIIILIGVIINFKK